jgi:hypothetical protein
MEFQTWVDFMDLWTNLICSWVGFVSYCFTKNFRKEGMGANLQGIWEKEFLNKEDIWEPICIKFEMKFFEEEMGIHL